MKQFKKATNKHLGDLLVERGVVNHEQLEISIEHQRKHPESLLGEIFVELKFATERDIAQALTCQYGFPYLPLSSYEIDDEVIRSVPEKVCRQFCLVPIDKIGKSLTVAMSNPLNLQALEDVELITGCSVQVFVSTATDVKQSIERYYKSP
jgi:type IV pilus assembly protein PilB